ncbi:MAG: ADP-forming succinate--CoA ligase subunit beta [SAR86 cluster bacterium]|nr:ADP-forming succinate--CoA ligase subunit beta [SAR86 cluster bacterium]
MNLHEYQAKALFKEFNIPVTESYVVNTPETAIELAKELNGNKWVVKVQVHAGGRGKAGGVEVVDSYESIENFVNKWIRNNIVTFQTDDIGQPVNQILIESCSDITDELYLGAVIDRASQRLVVMASREGGMDIEEIASKSPEKIFQVAVDPIEGPKSSDAEELGKSLDLDLKQLNQFIDLYLGLVNLFISKDLALLEINPLAITTEGNLLCVDAKINVDSNALYRQEEILAMRDITQEDEREAKASKWDLSYVALEGNIGCMVNGAGLAMGTMDIIKIHGGSPANFLDVGGTADSKRVAEAFKIILSDNKVQSVLINIFGGIVRCDIIAEGIISAVEEVGVEIPVVVRLEGNNAKLGSKLLNDSGLNIISAGSLEKAAELVVNSSI